MKRHKEPTKTPATNGEAQVFVLPPNLLEQLGIQLSSIGCPAEGIPENSIVCQSTKNNPEDVPGSVDVSSILETASLMKQSVFMSPTFVSSTATETGTNIATETEESIQDGSEPTIVNNVANNNAEFRNSIINATDNVALHSEDFEKYQSIKEYEVENGSGDLILTNVSYENCNNANIDRSSLHKTSPVDDHADEAYSSDGSNSYPGFCSEITNNNLEAASIQPKPSNKIKILSEQIINHSDLNTIQKSRIQKSSSCFLIPVNTIVTGKATKNPSQNHLEQKTLKEILCTTPEINFQKDDESGNVYKLETVLNKDTLVEHSVIITHPGSVVQFDGKEESSHKVETNDYSKTNGEVVLDVNKCIIPKQEDKKIKKIRENGKDEKLKVKANNDYAKEIASNTENSSSESKLCIQGVEKPGGTNENTIDAVLRTYQRTNIQKQIPELSHVDYTNIVDPNILPEDLVKELDDINMGGYKNANKFCICSDFGQLENYDSDVAYEHIHFCDHNNAGCNLETLFSMYDDTFALRELNITEDIDVVDDVIENTQHNICWLSFICEDNEALELASLDSENMDAGQPRRSNRKRKSTASEQVTENVQPKSKKTIKCGAGVLLTEVEWNKHKDSEHILIASKDNQTIVENTSTAIDNEKLSKDALQKKDTIPKLTQPNRRYSRKLNIEINVSEFCDINTSESKINSDHSDVSSKHVQKSIESDIQSKSKKSATSVLIETPTFSIINSIETSSKLAERDVHGDSSTFIDVTSPNPTRKSELEVSLKSNIISFGNDAVSNTKPIVKSLGVEGPARCTRQSKSFDVPSKSPALEVTSKSTRRSLDVSTKTTEIKKTTKAEIKDSPKSPRKYINVSSKSTEIKNTRKSSRKSTEVSSKSTEIKETPKPEIKDIPKVDAKDNLKLTRKSIDVPSEIKETRKSSKKSIEVSSKFTEIKDTPKPQIKDTLKANVKDNQRTRSINVPSNATEIKDTPKSTRRSIDVSSKPTEIKTTPNEEAENTRKSTKSSIKVEVTTKSNIATKGEVSSETTRTFIDSQHNPTQNAAKVASKSNDASTSKLKTMPIDFPKKSTRKSDLASKETEKSIGNVVPQNLMSKSKDNEITTESIEAFMSQTTSQEHKNVETASTTRKLKEIDIFSSSSLSRKSKNIETQPKLTKNSIDDAATSKLANVETNPKSTRISTDVYTKAIEARGSNKTKRKPIDAEVSSKIIRDKVPKETKEVFSPTPTKETNYIYIASKPIEKSLSSSSSQSNRKSIGMTTTETISTIFEKTIDPKSQIKSNILSNVSSKSPQSNDCLEIDIPAQIESTADNDTESVSKSNSQGISADASSSYNSGNDIANSSSNHNSITTTEDSNKSQAGEKIFVISIKQEILPKCGVCNQEVEDSQWLEHIGKEHDYLAWREDEPPLDLQDDKVIRAHLYAILKANGGLKCSKCDVVRKYVKSYLTHLRNCNGYNEEQNQMDVSTTSVDNLDIDTTQDLDDIPLKSYSRGAAAINAPRVQHSVVCGVCSESVLENKWIDHIRMEHKYLAWKSGEPPLNVDDETEVKNFLQKIAKHNGGLICSKCGIVRLYVKKWLDHEATCNGKGVLESTSSLELTGSNVTPEFIEIEILTDTVKCAKCGKEMPTQTWTDHIQKEHNYLSWIEGQPPLDETNPEAVSAYLHSLVRKHGSLYCVKCGVTRKYPKAFLTHISACEISGFKREDFYVEVSAEVKPGEYECAVCHERGDQKQWKKHAMEKHYNVAWMAGEIPINLKNFYAVEKYLKEYRKKYNLVCKVCGASRASCYGFYAHVMTCGKAEDELDHVMNMCDICNNKYLCIYRNQHMAMHREQVFKKEKRERDAVKAEEQKHIAATETLEEGEPTGKRRAAEKAKKVMESYSSNVQDGSHVCVSCHIEFDTATQLKDHECRESNEEQASDSDVSVKMEAQEESEDDVEDVDSTISDEEEDPLKRKRHPETIPKMSLPFKVKDFNNYLAKSFDHFCELHYTNVCLFNNWRNNDYSILSEEEASRYLPALTESCKLRVGDEWETYKRFEATKKRDMTLFTGAAVRCMRWVPPRVHEDRPAHYLSVACFRDGDCPRYGSDELPQHPAMLQIWKIGRFMTIPKFEMGLAHDYGTVWSMDWCSSGTRDSAAPECPSEVPSGSAGPLRLGLLAIACSNGCAYILSVPRFHTEPEDEPKIIKLKPVAELRLSKYPRRPPFRVGYQATSISWSPQKDHEVVMVGYSDGTTALYNLNTASSLLKEVENGVHIYYPFQDALTENSPITGVALSASADLSRIVGGAASSSVTGASMAGWPRAAPMVRSHLAASSVLYTPNWPAALLCSDDVLTLKSTNEMEWWGGGRRLGGACAAGACAHCGRVCLAAPPFVRVLRAHPCYPELKKQIVATMKMVPIARKRKLKIVNDDLGMIIEPLTYDETIKKYGLEFKTVPKKDQNVASKLCDNAEQCAERFPLSDMSAAAFCPCADHHNRLAVASHAGFIFIIST